MGVRANRTSMQRSVVVACTEKPVAEVNALKVGDDTEASVTQGLLIDGRAVEKIEGQVAHAAARGGLFAGRKGNALGLLAAIVVLL